MALSADEFLLLKNTYVDQVEHSLELSTLNGSCAFNEFLIHLERVAPFLLHPPFCLGS